MDETRPNKKLRPHAADDLSGDATRPVDALQTKPHPVIKHHPMRKTILFLFMIMATTITVLGGSALLGYKDGDQLRIVLATARMGEVALEQYEIGMTDFNAGRYELALQRFEYILEIEPEFPGVADRVNEILILLNKPTRTASPTFVTPTSTPLFVSLDALFQGAEEALVRSDWTVVIDTLVNLRGNDLDYRTEDVEGMLYVALRNRGLDRIWQGMQEQGIYDLNRAERFGVLDHEASSWRNSAAFYMTANSYLGIDWSLASQYFSQICAGGTWDSCGKYAFAAMNYAAELALEEDWCAASHWYDQSLRTFSNNDVAPTATHVAIACMTATAPIPTGTVTMTPTIDLTLTISATPTPTATEGAVIDTETPTPTATEPLVPSDTPEPKPTETFTPTPTG